MGDLIEALQILLKYGNAYNPTHCEHDDLLIVDIDPQLVSSADRVRLKELGFTVTEAYGEPCFHSFRFGSA